MSIITKHINFDNVALLALPITVAIIVVRLTKSHHPRTTKLKGPANPSFLLGVSRDIFTAPDHGAVYENWEKEYGSIFEVPSTLGEKVVVLCDPKAITHFFSKDTYTYRQTPNMRNFVEYYVRCLLQLDLVH